ncbi:MAG: DNA/RNA helicase domain-containing protein [Fimbriimonadaceae bacterium]
MSAYYRSSLKEFVDTPIEEVFQSLSVAHALEFQSTADRATLAWHDSLPGLQKGLAAMAGMHHADSIQLLFEYRLPRLRSRVDLVIVHPLIVVVVEVKTGRSPGLLQESCGQASRYRQELKDFHEASRLIQIAPIAIGPDFPYQLKPADWTSPDVVPVATACFDRIGQLAAELLRCSDKEGIPRVDCEQWVNSRYFPVPPITQAITELFEQQDISEIAHSHAGPEEVQRSVRRIVEIAEQSRERKEKSLLVLTGAPGAGKTLVGLSGVAALQRIFGAHLPSAFLSGNGPLVKVLQETLVRWMTERGHGGRTQRQLARRYVQEVHFYIGELASSANVPAERIVFYDEAQRAWSAEHLEKKAKQHRNVAGTTISGMSEAQQLLAIADRHPDWAVVVALVGAGQEIHRGEAGLAAWGKAALRFPHWKVYASKEAIRGGEAVAGHRIFEGAVPPGILEDSRLHLAVSKRSYEAENHAEWVNALLAGDWRRAKALAEETRRKTVLCRDLSEAREWLHERGRFPYRSGLVASSGAVRLRSQGIEPPSYNFLQGYPIERWFLDSTDSIHSSSALEVAMSEFEVQGLELDYVGVCWGGDLVPGEHGWTARRFDLRKEKWVVETDPVKRSLTFNKYRVLLTRFRKGMIVFVPAKYRHPVDDVSSDDQVASRLIEAGCVPLSRP